MQQVLLYVNAYAKTGNRSTFMYKKNWSLVKMKMIPRKWIYGLR